MVMPCAEFQFMSARSLLSAGKKSFQEPGNDMPLPDKVESEKHFFTPNCGDCESIGEPLDEANAKAR
jgi:hypothetical protein